MFIQAPTDSELIASVWLNLLLVTSVVLNSNSGLKNTNNMFTVAYW